MDDLISRQAAIDALHMDTSIIPFEKAREYADATISEIRNRLEKLPPAEPQIIRCNECKWNRTENRKETKQWLPCRALVTPDGFSCIYAERRTE